MAATIDAERRSRRRVSLSLTLALCIGALVVVAVATVLAVSWLAGLRNTFAFINQNAISVVNTIDSRVRGHLEPAEAQLRFLERQIRAGRVDTADPDNLHRVLLGALAAAPQIGAILFWNRELQLIGASKPPGGPVQLERRDDSADELVRSVWEEVQTVDGAVWGEPVFVPEASDTFLNLRRPVRNDRDEVIGFLIAVVAMRELSNFMTEIGDSFGATAFILHGEGSVLAHPILTSPHPDLRPDQPMVAVDRVGDLVVSGYRDADFEGPFQLAADAGVSIGRIELAGGEVHVAFSGELADFGPVPWTIGAHLPIDQVNKEAQRILLAGGLGVVMLVVSVLLAVLVGRLIARPVTRVAAGTSQIGHLELATISELPASRIRELDEQASSFNAMLHGLRWFETYVPKRLVERLIRHGSKGHIDSTERELTVLFTDIVGFTTASERMSPRETEEFLNNHFGLLSRCVEAEDGTIDKFIGDALMAFWGAPDDQPDHATRACRAAKAIQAAIEADNDRREELGAPRTRVRLGIHTDRVVVGNIGAPGRMNYTIVGDGVNTGQRLEGLGKKLDDGSDVVVLVSAATANGVDRRQVQLHQVGHFEVKGKGTAVEVFRLKR